MRTATDLPTSARSTYMTASVATATPARLLVMLYDRLLLDVERAVLAQQEGQHEAASGHLLHGQEILLELRTTLDVDAWEGGPGLGALYDWLHQRLVEANMYRDVTLTESCRSMVADLATTWRQAALAAAVTATSV